MVLEVGIFKRCLGHQGGALWMGFGTFLKETPQRSLSLAPYTMLSTQWERSCKAVNQGEGLHQKVIILPTLSYASPPQELWAIK